MVQQAASTLDAEAAGVFADAAAEMGSKGPGHIDRVQPDAMG
jgi:hypothetical protein